MKVRFGDGSLFCNLFLSAKPIVCIMSWLSVVAICGIASVSLAEPKAVGLIILSKGQVTALSVEGRERELKRRSSLFSGDKITTGEGAKVQIKFTDGSIISLRNNTQLQIENYQYSEQSGQEKSILKLVKGGFRAITGVIGKSDPKDYQVKTNLATIGIRGTHFELVMGQELGVAVWDGGVWVENDAGKVLLGKDASFQFALVQGVDQLPKGLLKPPAGISSAVNKAAAKSASRKNDTQEKDSSDQGARPQNEADGDGKKQPSDNKQTRQEKSQLADGESESVDQSIEGKAPANQDKSHQGTEAGQHPQVAERLDESNQLAVGTELESGNGDQGAPPVNNKIDQSTTDMVSAEGTVRVDSSSSVQNDFAGLESLSDNKDVQSFSLGDGSTLNEPKQESSTGFEGPRASPSAAAIPEQWGPPIGTSSYGDGFLDSPIQPLPPENIQSCSDSGDGQSCVGTVDGFDFEAGEVGESGEVGVEEVGAGGDLADGRLSDQELQGLLPLATLAVAAGGSQAEALPFVWLDGLQVSVNDQEAMVFVSNTNVSSDGDVITPLHVIRKGQSTLELGPDLMVAPSNVFYGVWRGDVAPVQVYSNAGESDSFSGLDFPVFWIHAPPISEGSLNALSGMYYFDQVSFFSGESNSGPVTHVNLRFDIDLASLRITDGELRIGSGPVGRPDLENVWQFDFVGGVEGDSIRVEDNALDGTYRQAGATDTQLAEGMLSGFITGDSGDLLVGAFYVNALQDESLFAAGVYGVTSLHPLDRLGLLSIASGKQFGLTADNASGQVLDQAVIGGRSSDGGAGSAQLEHREGGPFNSEFESSPLIYSVNRGQAGFQVLQNQAMDDFHHDVTAGVWLGNVETPVNVTTAVGVVNVDRPVYWLTALPSPIEAMNLLQGVGVFYNQGAFYSGEGSAGPITDFQMGFSVDFVNNQIHSGTLSVDVDNGSTQDFWQFSFEGAINDQILMLDDNTDGSVCSDQSCSGSSSAAEGEVTGLFVGGGAGSVVGAFRFWEVGDVNRFVAGVYGVGTIDETLGFDNRIGGDFSSGEAFELTASAYGAFLALGSDQASSLIEGDGDMSAMVFGGPAIIDSDAGQLNLLKDHSVEPFGVVFRPGVSSLDAPGNDLAGADRSVYWGRWGAGSLIQDDATEEASTITLADPVFWVAGNITSINMLPKSMERTYQTTVMLQGEGYNGAISNGSIQMTVDFDSVGDGVLSNGQLSYQTGGSGSQWNVGFNGVSNGGVIDMELISATLTETGNSRPLQGDLQGAFVGENQETQGVIGGFQFEVIGDPGKHSQGAFWLAQ